MPRKPKTTHDVSVRGETYILVKNFCLEKEAGTEEKVRPGAEVSVWIDEHFDRLEVQEQLAADADYSAQVRAEREARSERKARADAELEAKAYVEPKPRKTQPEIEAEARDHFTW